MATRSIQLRGRNIGTHNSIAKNIFIILLYRVFRIQSLFSMTGTWRMVSIMLTFLVEFVHRVQTTKWKMQSLSALHKYSTEVSLSLSARLLFNYREFSNPATIKTIKILFRAFLSFPSHGKNAIYLITLYT